VVPANEERLPATLERSPRKAQRTYLEALDSAHETYGGDEEAAHRVAFAALKHSWEKVGDRWVEKDEKGPSDPRAESGGPDARGETFGGVDVHGNTKAELYERARRLGVRGRSKMSKAELARAIARKQ
jgi:cation transport regulator ChaB